MSDKPDAKIIIEWANGSSTYVLAWGIGMAVTKSFSSGQQSDLKITADRCSAVNSIGRRCSHDRSWEWEGKLRCSDCGVFLVPPVAPPDAAQPVEAPTPAVDHLMWSYCPYCGVMAPRPYMHKPECPGHNIQLKARHNTDTRRG